MCLHVRHVEVKWLHEKDNYALLEGLSRQNNCFDIEHTQNCTLDKYESFVEELFI